MLLDRERLLRCKNILTQSAFKKYVKAKYTLKFTDCSIFYESSPLYYFIIANIILHKRILVEISALFYLFNNDNSF